MTTPADHTENAEVREALRDRIADFLRGLGVEYPYNDADELIAGPLREDLDDLATLREENRLLRGERDAARELADARLELMWNEKLTDEDRSAVVVAKIAKAERRAARANARADWAVKFRGLEHSRANGNEQARDEARRTVGRLQRERDAAEAKAAEAQATTLAERVKALEAALVDIRDQPENFDDGRSSYSQGYAFYLMKERARATLSQPTRTDGGGHGVA